MISGKCRSRTLRIETPPDTIDLIVDGKIDPESAMEKLRMLPEEKGREMFESLLSHRRYGEMFRDQKL